MKWVKYVLTKLQSEITGKPVVNFFGNVVTGNKVRRANQLWKISI